MTTEGVLQKTPRWALTATPVATAYLKIKFMKSLTSQLTISISIIALLLLGCNSSTSEQYTIHYEMRGTNPLDP